MRKYKKRKKLAKKLYKFARKRPVESFVALIVALVTLAHIASLLDEALGEHIMLITVGILVTITIVTSLKWSKKRKTERLIDICEVDKLSGLEFEHFLKPVFERQGYKVEVTQGSGDYGADLVLRRRERKYVVQAKCYSSNIGVSAIQQIVAAVPFYKADGAMVVTNQYFTKQAQLLAAVNKVQLVDRDELASMMNASEQTVSLASVVFNFIVKAYKRRKEKATLD